MNRFLIFFLLLPLASCNLFRQVPPPSNPQTEALLIKGKQFLQKEDYLNAWDAFEMAREQEFNRSTTAAIYLAGLSAYRLTYMEIAAARFSQVLQEYPRSKYAEDAKYHLALIQLSKPKDLTQEFAALNQLITLYDNARDPRLKQLALASWRNHLFAVSDRDVLESYLRNAPDAQQGLVMEALLYQVYTQDGPQVALARLKTYREEGGKVTPWTDALLPLNTPALVVADPRWKDPNLLKIALVLPFQLDQAGYPGSLSSIPSALVRPLEFYEGFQMAVDEFQTQSPKRVYLSVIDSRRDTFQIRRLFSKLDSLGIQFLVGDIYNAQSRVLSDWSESRRVPQLIPLSPSEELITDKRNTFLANPTARTHGARMAEYAYDKLGLRRIFAFTDGSESTEELLDGFQKTFLSRGGSIDTLAFSQNYQELAVKEIPKLARSIPDQGRNVGVYIPVMGNEEASSLILNILLQQGKRVPVLGSPHFRSSYNSIPSETKANFNLIFSTSYLIDTEDPQYQQFYQKYLTQFSFPPSENAIQGYDTGKYVLRQLSAYSPDLGFELSAYLRASGAVPSLHIPYRFQSTQSNQLVNLGQYTDLGVIRLE